MNSKLKVLFLCTGNSCRSQMAEGLARYFKSGQLEAYSAGADPRGLDPYAVKVMKEIGIDISKQKSKSVSELEGIKFDYVITLCSEADKTCPAFSGGAKRVHMGFDDPPRLAEKFRNEKDILLCYRNVRDDIRDFIMKFPDSLQI